jgi:hypothetical protein
MLFFNRKNDKLLKIQDKTHKIQDRHTKWRERDLNFDHDIRSNNFGNKKKTIKLSNHEKSLN